MTCAGCNGTRHITIALPDPCATPDEIWCPECSDPPPPFRAGAAGFWWARWITADAGTREGDDLTPSLRWEVVEVVINGLDSSEPDYLRVSVCGVEKSQSLDGFEWGPPVSRPRGLTDGGGV